MEDCAAHDWYRFVLSFPPHLVRDYVESFSIGPGQCILDPFCGRGAIRIESKDRSLNFQGGISRQPHDSRTNQLERRPPCASTI